MKMTLILSLFLSTVSFASMSVSDCQSIAEKAVERIEMKTGFIDCNAQGVVDSAESVHINDSGKCEFTATMFSWATQMGCSEDGNDKNISINPGMPIAIMRLKRTCKRAGFKRTSYSKKDGVRTVKCVEK